MEQIPYLIKLQEKTVNLPAIQREQIMDTYSLYFEVGALDELSVAEVTEKLPSPAQAVQNYLAAKDQRNAFVAEPPTRNRRGLLGTLLIGGFLFFLSILTLITPSIAAFGIAVGLGVGGLTILSYGMSLMHIAFLPIFPAFFSISEVMATHPIASGILGIGLTSLGLFFVLAAIRVIQTTIRLMSRYFRWHKRVLRGGN